VAGNGNGVGSKGDLDLIVIALGKYESHPGENMRAAAQLNDQVSGLQIGIGFELPVFRGPC
jgi:hypothetical protein